MRLDQTRKVFGLAVAAALVLSAAGSCKSGDSGGGGSSAEALIQGQAGSSVHGVARFTEVGGGVRVVIEVTGAPRGPHAVHLHEVGDCSAEDFSSAGSHFNPDGKNHGGPNTHERHPGDFGNMMVNSDGNGRIELVTADLTVKPGRYSVVGKSIIVHEKEDDLVSQPTGNAGGRIGCGVVLLEP